jgi:hypothetical protein
MGTHKCTKRAAVGDTCTYYEQCATFVCTNGKCAENPPICVGK